VTTTGLALGHKKRELLPPPFWKGSGQLDVILAAILLGPLTVLQIAGRTPALFWVDVIVVVIAADATIRGILSARGLRIPTIMKWPTAYLLVAFASLSLTADPLAGIALFKLRIMPAAVFLVTIRVIETKDDVDHFYASVIVFGCLLAAMSLYNWYEFSRGILVLSEDYGSKDMLQSSFGRSNFLASIFIIVIPLCIAYIRKVKSVKHIVLYGSGLSLLTVALLFTQSRGALISLTVGMCVWGLVTVSHSFTIRRVATTAAIAVAVPVTVILAWPAIPENVRVGLNTAFGVLLAQMREGNYGGDRTEQWAAALQGAWSSHLLGIGLGNQIPFYNRLGLTPSAHSLYLETLLETGLIGLLTLLLTLGGFAKILRRLWQTCTRQDRLLVGALIASFVTALVNVAQETSFWAAQYSYVFWMMMGAAYSWSRHQGPYQKAKGEILRGTSLRMQAPQ
jgi:O-antigen ligase